MKRFLAAALLFAFVGSASAQTQGYGPQSGGGSSSGCGNAVACTSLTITPAITAFTTSQAQAAGGSTILPFASIISPITLQAGYIVSGTNIPLGDQIGATTIQTATKSHAANGSFLSGQKVIPMNPTTGYGVLMQCKDTTNPSAIGAGNTIASINPNVSITLVSNTTGASGGATDTIVCDPTIVLTIATSGTVGNAATVNFNTQNTADASSSFVDNGDAAIAGNARVYGALSAQQGLSSDTTVTAGTSVNAPTVNVGTDGAVQGTIVLNNTSGIGDVTLQSSNSTSGPYTLTLPPNPVNGGVLTSDGSGTTTFVAPADAGLLDLQYFGDGSDGDVTCSGASTLTRDMYYRNLTISAGCAITTHGWRIYASGTLDISAAPAGAFIGSATTAATAGGNGGAGAGGTGAGVNVAFTSQIQPNYTTGSTGGGGAGGTGGISAAGSNGAAVGSVSQSFVISAANLGTGGTGGTGVTAAGGTGGALAASMSMLQVKIPFLWGFATITMSPNSSGGGGGGGSVGVGGGGGGGSGGVSGDTLFVFARTIARGSNVTAAIFQCKGLVGGAGGAGFGTGVTGGGGGGSGGNGGLVFVVYRFITGSAITNAVDVSSGAGGAAGNGNSTGTGGTGGASGLAGVFQTFNLTTQATAINSGTSVNAGTGPTGATGGPGGAAKTAQFNL